jgi:hypothetical protein
MSNLDAVLAQLKQEHAALGKAIAALEGVTSNGSAPRSRRSGMSAAGRQRIDGQSCRHQLDRPPELASDVDGVSYLVFECVLCGCEVSLRLNSEGEIDGEFIVPPSSKRA